jgi:hypothetical protein
MVGRILAQKLGKHQQVFACPITKTFTWHDPHGLFHTQRTFTYHHLHLSEDDGMDEQQIDWSCG